MSSSPHLRPASADDLRPRPAPQAAPGGDAPELAPLAPAAPQSHLHPAVFESKTTQPDGLPAFQEPYAPADADSFPQEESYLMVEDPFLLMTDEDDEDDDEPDAVPTEEMPVPVCVPLFDLSDVPKRGLFGKKG